MFDTVIHNAKLYPMSESAERSDKTQIGIKNGIIQQLGNEDLENRFTGKEVIDANGACLLPGFIDCHTHIVYASDRSEEHSLRLQGVSYAEVHAQGGGIQSSVKAVRQASIEDLVQESVPRIKNLLKEGVTSLEIKSGYGLDLDNEFKMLRAIKQCQESLPVEIVSTFLGAHTIPKNSNKSDYLQSIINDMLPVVAEEKLANFVDIYVEHIAFDNDDMQKLFNAAEQYGFKTRAHTEQLSNMQASKTAAELGAKSVDHLEYLDQESIKAMAKHSTTAVLLPNAFYFLNEKQLPPIDLMREHNINMAIATDCNPGTAPIPSLLTALHFAVHLFGLTPSEALLGVTINAARALDIDSRKGSIEVGKAADLCLWNLDSPEFLCYQLGGVNPESIFINGKRI